MLFPQRNLIATLSCINLSSPSLCNSHMGFYLKILLHKISILQNKAVKIVTQTKWKSSANSSYNNLKVLKLNKLYLCEFGKIMYNLHYKQHPCQTFPPYPLFLFPHVYYFIDENYKTATIFLIPGR